MARQAEGDLVLRQDHPGRGGMGAVAPGAAIGRQAGRPAVGGRDVGPAIGCDRSGGKPQSGCSGQSAPGGETQVSVHGQHSHQRTRLDVTTSRRLEPSLGDTGRAEPACWPGTAARRAPRRSAVAEQDPAQDRDGRGAVGDDRLEVRALVEAGRGRVAAHDARRRHRVRARPRLRPPPAAAPRPRCPTSRASPGSRWTAGWPSAAPARPSPAPPHAPGTRRRPSAQSASSPVMPMVWMRTSRIALTTARR